MTGYIANQRTGIRGHS